MDLPLSPHVLAIFEAQTFSSLLTAVQGPLGDLLGPETVQETSLFLFHEDSVSTFYVVNSLTLHKKRQFRPYFLARDSQGDARLPAEIQILPQAPVRLLQLLPHQSSPLSDVLTGTLILALGAGDDAPCPGLLVLGLNREALELEEAVRDGLAQIVQAIGRVAPKILHFELNECHHRQLLQLHESMAKTAVSFDRSALLSNLLVILNRQFGFSRIMMALVHGETQTLRSELHSGFSSSFDPFIIRLDETKNPFLKIMNQGEVRVFSGNHELFAEMPEVIREARIERGILLPLKVGEKLLGLIYADQALHDGAPHFADVFKIFAQMAAAALENLNLRVRAEQRAETDALTGLYNRYFLNKILEIEIPRVKRYNHPISLLMIDLCDFKRFNDTYGHQFGDYILRETSNLLQANVRRPDIVIRYGGDEFVVLMVNTTMDQANLVRERIEQAFIERNRLQTDECMAIRISMGLRAADAQTIEGLLHEADMEMYAHKARQMRAHLIVALLTGCIEKIELADRIVGSLCNILYKKAPYYRQHAQRAMNLCVHLARRIGLSENEIEELALGALLHDVGKVSIPTELLQKVEPLTAAEIAAMRHHPILGEEFFHGLDYLEPIRPIIRSHHERYDGQTTGIFPGYPDGLCGDRIPLPARILRIAETAECMLSGRPYRAPRPSETVGRLLREESGKSFDPNLINLLLLDADWDQTFDRTESIASLDNS